jgi:hypothetical protein
LPSINEQGPGKNWLGETLTKVRDDIIGGLRINRDVNGARGIFLRALRDLSWVWDENPDLAFVGNYS